MLKKNIPWVLHCCFFSSSSKLWIFSVGVSCKVHWTYLAPFETSVSSPLLLNVCHQTSGLLPPPRTSKPHLTWDFWEAIAAGERGRSLSKQNTVRAPQMMRHACKLLNSFPNLVSCSEEKQAISQLKKNLCQLSQETPYPASLSLCFILKSIFRQGQKNISLAA